MNEPTYTEVGCLWRNTTKHGGQQYLSGYIRLPGGELLRLSIFPNPGYVPDGSRPEQKVYAHNVDLTLIENEYEAIEGIEA